MGDEQTPQSDLIDDAIRQAEQQLEAKLEALRMSALGDITPFAGERPSDVALLRPTEPFGGSVSSTEAKESAASIWQEAAGDDLSFVPADGEGLVGASADVLPSSEGSLTFPGAAGQITVPEPASPEDVDDFRTGIPSSVVHDLLPTWDDADDLSAPAFVPDSVESSPWSLPASDLRPYEPADKDIEPVVEIARAAAGPTPDELRFWEQTRTALADLHQVASTLPDKIAEQSESAAKELRTLQQQLQQSLPRLGERVEAYIEEAIALPTRAMSQLREELPAQVDGAATRTRMGIREDLDRVTATVQSAVQKDVNQLEQAIASNVTRMAQSVTEGVTRVEREVGTVGDRVARVEREIHGELIRVQAQLHGSVERSEQAVRDELVEPIETVRKLEAAIPGRIARVERVLLEQMQATHRELSTAMAGLVDANRASLDRIASMASTLDEERTRRAEDVDLVVDTVTTGWEGLAGAVKALFAQGEEQNRRIAEIEERISSVHDLEHAVQATMAEFQMHVANLAPAPVIVTVAHPEAEVRNTARAGWLPEKTTD